MYEMVQRSTRCALLGALVLVPLSGAAMAQEGESTEEFRNVQLVFHLVQADGFTEQDPEIADVVTELRKTFNFRGYRLQSTSIQNVALERGLLLSDRLKGHGTQRIVAGDSGEPWELSVEISGARSSPTIRIAVSLTNVVPWMIRENATVDPVETYLEASMTIRDGQKVVLGSTRPAAGEPMLFLVVTPRFEPEG